MPQAIKAVQINPLDTVAVLTAAAEKGRTIALSGAETLTVLEEIPAGHKIALRGIAAGELVVKYGCPIGRATAEIPRGAWVHTHNLATSLTGETAYRFEKAPAPPKGDELLFEGFLRGNGSVGTRNEIWILPMVSCVNHTAHLIAERFRGAALPPNSGGVFALSQPFGCSQLGGDHQNTVTMLKNLALHPNAGGVLLLSLGCENNSMPEFLAGLGDYDHSRIRPLVCQEHEDEVEAGTALVQALLAASAGDRRSFQPFSKLRVGLKCGASDGFSGITANPLVGALCGLLTRHGAACVLTETPEMFGAEALLLNRAADSAVFERGAAEIEAFKRYYTDHGQPIYENPSPGNKAGGITTLEEKSLGCVQKGGDAEITDVLGYGGRVKRPGLTLLSAPGNDPVSITALAGAGCQLLLFTTGRGNPLATVVPTIKIASNAALALKKSRWIDFDASCVLEDGTENSARALFALLLQVANGRKKTASEVAGYREIGILKDGVTL